MRTKIILATIGVLVLAVLFWFFYHSRLEVVVTNPASGKSKVTIINQSSGKEDVAETESSFSKTIPRGGYTILVTQNNKSYISQVHAPGFFTKKTVTATLEPEKARMFVGNNPAPCKFYSETILSSYECDNNTKTVSIHTPANQNQPTTTITDKNVQTVGTLEGTVQTKEGTIALIRTPASAGVVDHHALYLVKTTVNGNIYTPLKQDDISGSAPFSITNYKEGFAVFSPTLGKIQTYESTTTKPTNIEIKNPGKEMDMAYATGNKTSLAVVYVDKADQASDDTHVKGKTKVIVYTNGKTKEYGFGTSFIAIRLCSSQHLCALNPESNKLEVYAIGGSKAKRVSQIPGVTAISSTANGVVFLKGSYMVQYDPVKNFGSIEYSTTGYNYCGVQNLSTSYILCLSDIKKNRVALLVDQNTPDTDNIDKNIAELQQLPEVTRISTYGKYIFITPNVGDPQYIPSLKSYGYNPTTKKVVNDKINGKMSQLGIDPKVYTIVNTAGQ